MELDYLGDVPGITAELQTETPGSGPFQQNQKSALQTDKKRENYYLIAFLHSKSIFL
jgi:hypothetical protein